MTNPDYISSMTLSAWKLYTPEERLELFKESELKVNRFESSIAGIEFDNMTNKETLNSAKVARKQAKNNVEKLMFELEHLEEEKAEEIRQKEIENELFKEGI